MEKNLIEDLRKSVEEITPWAVNLRRKFHSWPEVGNQEYRTTEWIKKELDAMSIPTKQPLNTGIIGLLEGDKDKTIALRADIDGLPIQERIRLPFSSERQGFMHGCGHDVHIAVLLGTAKVLSEHKDKIKRSIKFIFQPAEETTGGAERMIDAGCLKDPKVQSIYGFHVKPEIVAGKIGLKKGRVHACSDQFTIRVQGMASHGAYPDCGVDALVSASQIVTNIQAIVSRNISPLDSAVITIGSFHSGSGVNTIADRAILEGTIRSFDPMTREHLRCRLKDTVEFTAKAAGASAEVEFIKGYDALINHDEGVKEIADKAGYILGPDSVIEIESPSMGVEDFAYYLHKVPGAFFFLGSGYPYRENPPLHSDSFQVNEACIQNGILLLAGLCL